MSILIIRKCLNFLLSLIYFLKQKFNNNNVINITKNTRNGNKTY